MHSDEKIRRFMETSVYRPRLTGSELRKLPGILYDNEVLRGLLEGHLLDTGTVSINKHGLMILTDQRLIFYSKNLIAKDLLWQMPMSDLNTANIYFSSLHKLSYLIISTFAGAILFERCEKSAAEEFIGKLRA